MYFPVLGDMRAVLSAKEVFVIAKEFLAPLLGQSFLLAKIMSAKIADQDTASSLVIFSAKRPAQIEVWKPSGPLRMPRIRFDERKAAKPLIAIVLIFDLQLASIGFWDFNCSCFLRQTFCLVSELAVEFRQRPEKPIWILQNYFRKRLPLISAKWHHAPTHVCTSLFELNDR